MARWDFERNGFIKPENVGLSADLIWFVCNSCNNPFPLAYSKNNICDTIEISDSHCPFCGVNNATITDDYNNNTITKINDNDFVCEICGKHWDFNIKNKYKRGCPNCIHRRQTSIPEQLIYISLKRFFPKTINRYKCGKDEIDVYIPELNLGIEYDGQQFHTIDRIENDISKSNRIIANGVHLIRFRESGCPTIKIPDCECIDVIYSVTHSDLEKKLLDVLKKIHVNTNLAIPFNKIINDVTAVINLVPYELSFAAFQKSNGISRALWDYELNAPLKPEMVMPFSDKMVYWICPNNSSHRWRNTVKSVSLGYGCRKCSPRKLYTTAEWIEAAKKVHGNRYHYHLVKYIDATTDVEIICPKHGVFLQPPIEHLSGKGCKYCAHQAFHHLESLAILYPDIAAEWDYEKNKATGITPNDIGIDSTQEFWWHCDKGCDHSYKATISYRVHRKSGCSVCHGKQTIYETSVGYLYPQLTKEWCVENDKTPFEVPPGSEYEALWKCPNPNHEPYRCMVINRTKHNVGCKYCSRRGKKHPKDYEDELKIKHPTITLLSPFIISKERVRCQCNICGYIWNPYPYNLLKGKGCPKCR